MHDPNIYYKDKNGLIQYNEVCNNCNYPCKQSFRTNILVCKKLIAQRKKVKK